MKHLKRYNEDIEWEFDDEEDDLNLPVELRRLDGSDFKELLDRLKIGDRFNFSFIKTSVNGTIEKDSINGTIKFIGRSDYKKLMIGIEFDEYINGHDGGNYFNGKADNCWFFYHDNNYNLIINKRV